MTPQEYLELVANIVKSDIPNDDGKIYVTKFDGSYITRFGMEEDVRFLIDRGITDNLQHGVGFSPIENKWYGWSHRAIFGFTIGSEVKRGECAYSPTDPEDFLQDSIRFWSDPHHTNVTGNLNSDGTATISWVNTTDPKLILNEKARGQPGSSVMYPPEQWGNGEWVANTMEDAKQMAIDFNQGVS